MPKKVSFSTAADEVFILPMLGRAKELEAEIFTWKLHSGLIEKTAFSAFENVFMNMQLIAEKAEKKGNILAASEYTSVLSGLIDELYGKD